MSRKKILLPPDPASFVAQLSDKYKDIRYLTAPKDSPCGFEWIGEIVEHITDPVYGTDSAVIRLTDGLYYKTPHNKDLYQIIKACPVGSIIKVRIVQITQSDGQDYPSYKYRIETISTPAKKLIAEPKLSKHGLEIIYANKLSYDQEISLYLGLNEFIQTKLDVRPKNPAYKQERRYLYDAGEETFASEHIGFMPHINYFIKYLIEYTQVEHLNDPRDNFDPDSGMRCVFGLRLKHKYMPK